MNPSSLSPQFLTQKNPQRMLTFKVSPIATASRTRHVSCDGRRGPVAANAALFA
jgi:hypothetical protein